MPTEPTPESAPSASTQPLEPRPVVAVDSWARRVGDAVRVVVVLEDDLRDEVGDALTTRRTWLRLMRTVDGEREQTRVLVEATPGPRPRLVADVPLETVAPSTWNLALRLGQGGPLVPLEARLLVTDTARQPLALLAGPRPETRMPAPAPR